MKKKLVFALAISLVMILILALPTLAAPSRGGAGIIADEAQSGGGSLLIVKNPDNTLDVTIRLAGALPNAEYGCNLNWEGGGIGSMYIGDIDTNDQGRGILHYTSTPKTGTKTYSAVLVCETGSDYVSSNTITFTFS